MRENSFTPLDSKPRWMLAIQRGKHLTCPVRKTFSNGAGFTVIEVLTVVIILGILATLSVPPFIKTMDAAKGRLAKTNLKLIYAAEKVYRNEVGEFMPYGGGTLSFSVPEDMDLIKKFLGLDIKDDPRTFRYEVTSSGDTFTATSTYQGSRYPGTTIKVYEDGRIESSYPPSP